MTSEQLMKVNKVIEEWGLENVENVILIKSGETNGDIVQMIFPNADIEIHNITVYVIFDMRSNVISFDLDWWNAPYKRSWE